MRILAIERDLPAVSTALPTDLLRREAAAVWALTKQDVIRELWFTRDRHAVILLECAGVAEARHHLDTLPLVRAGLIDFTVHELTPYDGFERLFSAPTEAPLSKPEAPAEY